MTELAQYLANNPGMTARDFKGKGFHEYNPFDKDYVREGELPWHELNPAEVREAALRNKARFLTKGQRQAAARDSGLIWNPISLAYCLRFDEPPSPSTVAAASSKAEGVLKVPAPTLSRPAAASSSLLLTVSPRILTDD